MTAPGGLVDLLEAELMAMDPQTAGARRKAERLAEGLSDWYRRWSAGSTAAEGVR